MDDDVIERIVKRGMERRGLRASMLRDAKKFTPLDRRDLEAIRDRHSADDIDPLLLDIAFLHHALDEALDNYHETLDRLNDARRELNAHGNAL